MFEHHRDEEVCRRWDVLADEDQTYHLSEQEYFYYKNKWWLHSNKQGSNTMPLRYRSDFKQALAKALKFVQLGKLSAGRQALDRGCRVGSRDNSHIEGPPQSSHHTS